MQTPQTSFATNCIIHPFNQFPVKGSSHVNRTAVTCTSLGIHAIIGFRYKKCRDTKPVVFNNIFLKLVVQFSCPFRRIVFSRILNPANTVCQQLFNTIRQNQIVVFIQLNSFACMKHAHLNNLLFQCHLG